MPAHDVGIMHSVEAVHPQRSAPAASLLACAAMACFGVSVAIVLVLHLTLGAEVNPVRQVISDYAVSGGALAFAVSALAMAAGAVLLLRGLTHAGIPLTTPIRAVAGIFPAGLTLCAFFPTTLTSAPASLSADVHRYAGAAQLQQREVRLATPGPVLRLAGLARMLRAPRWYLGLLLALSAAGLHIFALTLAPLVVVQPIGVLSLVLTVALSRSRPGPAMIAALLMSVGGVCAFVVLSANTPTASTGPNIGAAQWVALVAAALAVIGWRARARCVLLSLATAVLFGFASAMIRAAAQTLSTGTATGLLAVPVAEAVVATLVGSWLLHQAYASGSTSVVVGATTVVDPVTAVLIGVFAYRETIHPGQLVAAAAAVTGLLMLARAVPARPAPRPERLGEALRIVIAADTYPPNVNGASHFAHRLATGLAGHGHDVHVICPSATAEHSVATLNGVTVHRIGAIRTPFHPTFRICPPWRTARALPRLLSQIDPDLVHSQAHFLVGRSAIRAASASGIPVVATNHFMPENLFGYSPLPRWSHRPLSRLAWRDLVRVFRRAAVVTAPTPRAVQLLADNGLPGPAIAVSCGIDRTYFHASQPVPSDEPTVLFVGRLDAEKNVGELLEAAAALPPELNARVELVGDGTERTRLEALTAELGIADRVRFHGFVSDAELLSAYRLCDVFCMPGTAELQSIATMEAMAAGRPIVAANAMALPHLVRPGHNGWLHEPGDVDDLATRLGAVLADSGTRAMMGKASLDLISAPDIEATLATYEQL